MLDCRCLIKWSIIDATSYYTLFVRDGIHSIADYNSTLMGVVVVVVIVIIVVVV